jgi:hypothetical protein
MDSMEAVKKRAKHVVHIWKEHGGSSVHRFAYTCIYIYIFI